jgi:biotin transport system permease protein/energy-coupling factor transport system permease protein
MASVIFRYKKGKGLLYKTPAIIKIFFLLCASIGAMYLNFNFLLIAIIFFVFFAILCGISIKDLIADTKPAFYYASSLYAFNILVNALSATNNNLDTTELVFFVLKPDASYILLALRLLLIIQISALIFRTTSSIEIKDALCIIETKTRLFLKKYLVKNISLKTKLSTSLALTLSFIPEIFEQWSRIDRACRARKVKNNFRKFKILFTALLSISFDKAARKAKALAAREI